LNPKASIARASLRRKTRRGIHGWHSCSPIPVIATRASGPATKHQIGSPAAATAISWLNVGAAGADAAAAADAGYALISRWDQLSGAERAQLALSMGFWGVGTVASARSSGRVLDMFDPRTMRDALLARTRPSGSNPSASELRERFPDWYEYTRASDRNAMAAEMEQHLRQVHRFREDAPESYRQTVPRDPVNGEPIPVSERSAAQLRDRDPAVYSLVRYVGPDGRVVATAGGHSGLPYARALEPEVEGLLVKGPSREGWIKENCAEVWAMNELVAQLKAQNGGRLPQDFDLGKIQMYTVDGASGRYTPTCKNCDVWAEHGIDVLSNPRTEESRPNG